MKESKYGTLLKVSLGILIVSVALLCFSAYNFYWGKKEPEAKVDPAASLRAERDSLKAIYAATLQELDGKFGDSWKNADTLSADLDVKLAEFNRLRNEITNLLKEQNTTTDFSGAKEKIIELQQKVNALRNKNSDVESENQRLQAILDQLRANGKTEATPVVVKQAIETKTIVAEKSNKPIMASTLQLAAVNNAEKKTNASDQAEKFVGSFVLKNVADKKNTDLMVIVLQPDGKVVRNSVWESGSFETDEGRKVYSRKLSFNPSESDKQMNFSLSPERFFKGEYTMQIWYNGNLIGMLKKALS